MDESGDAGGNIRRGASPYFVVVFVETTEPETLREHLRDLRAEFDLPQAFESHYHDTRMPWAREAFFTLFRSLDVRVRAAVVDKARLPEDFEYGRDAMYQFVIGEMVIRASESELHDAILIVDGQRGAQTEDLLNRLRRYLTRLYQEHHRRRAFQKIVARNSKAEAGL